MRQKELRSTLFLFIDSVRKHIVHKEMQLRILLNAFLGFFRGNEISARQCPAPGLPGGPQRTVAVQRRFSQPVSAVSA